jgi:hypothetical protein
MAARLEWDDHRPRRVPSGPSLAFAASDLLLMAEDHVLVLGTEMQVDAIERTVTTA